jgi:hypothetical protein
MPLLSLFAFALAQAASAPPAPEAPLPPTGKWGVDYAQNDCVLSRDYGTPDARLTLGLRPWPMGTSTEIVLMTPRHAKAPFEEGHASMTIGAAQSVDAHYSRYSVPHAIGIAGTITTLSLDADALSGIERAQAVTLRVGDNERYTFAIPGIAAAMKALTTCQDDLLKSWGVDPAERGRIVLPPHLIEQIFTADDYPADAIRSGEQGRTIAIAAIQPDGRPASCEVVQTSSSKSLDEATCRILMTRLHVPPPHDQSGQPATGHLIVPIRWVIPAF